MECGECIRCKRVTLKGRDPYEDLCCECAEDAKK